MIKRIQRKRTKGSKMPDNCKYVGRPTKFGNPFKLNDGMLLYKCINRKIFDPWIIYDQSNFNWTNEKMLDLYELWITNRLTDKIGLPKPPDIEELRGFDLACFCPLNKPCHVDILLKLLYK